MSEETNGADDDERETETRYSSPEELTARQREAIEALLFRFADDELIAGERAIDWAVIAPTLEADVSIANIAQDELGHARLWYDALGEFGYTERELIYERDFDHFRHATVLEYPMEAGDWAGTIVRMYLYDTAEWLRLEAVADSTYLPIAARAERILNEESYHREHAENWLERLASTETGRTRLQDALDRLYQPAQTIFAGSDEPAVDGFRTESLSTLRSDWRGVVESKFTSLGLTVPPVDSPAPLGRDGNHTEHWKPLFDEIVETYHDLERTEPTKIMDDPVL